MASLFLTGFGAKLGLIRFNGSSFPFWDQWPAEAIDLFIPCLTGHYSPALLFQAHNEHTIVFTRISELLLLIANGQWDSRLEMVFNAAVHCAGMAVFGGLMASLFGNRHRKLLWALLTADLCLPFAWENTLWGFQSQFYFLLIFSLLTLWGMGLHEPFSRRWLMGAGTLAAASFSMATGFLAAAAVMGMTGMGWARQRKNWRRQLPAGAVCLLAIFLGFLLRKNVPEHSQFQAHSAGEFITVLAKCLAWPWPLKPWYAVFNIVPLALLGWKIFRAENPPRPAERMILGMGLWVFLQSAATAYARGAGGITPAWRYMDLLAFLMIANALAIAVLLEKQICRGLGWGLVFGLWAMGCVGGLWFLSDRAWRVYLPDFVAEQKAQLKVSREFLASDDPRVFQNVPASDLPVGNVEADIWLLRNPQVRAILPDCAFDRVQDDLKPGTAGSPREPAWLSLCTRRLLAGWAWFLAAGIGGFLMTQWMPFRRDKNSAPGEVA